MPDRDDMRRAKFFREDEDVPLGERTTPTPNEWLGPGRSKYRSSPAFSEEEETDGWREMYPREYSPPMENPLLPPETLKFKDEAGDNRALVFVLEQAAEVFEAEGHVDLAAECERLCEQVISEDE